MRNNDRWEPVSVPLGDGRHDIGDDVRAAIVERLTSDWSHDPDLTPEKVRQLAMWAGASIRALLHELGTLRDLAGESAPALPSASPLCVCGHPATAHVGAPASVCCSVIDDGMGTLVGCQCHRFRAAQSEQAPQTTPLALQAIPGDKQWAVRLRYPSTRQYLADHLDIPWPFTDRRIAEERAAMYGGDVVDYPAAEVAKARVVADTPTGGSDEAHPRLSGETEAGTGQAEDPADDRMAGADGEPAGAGSHVPVSQPAPVASSAPVTVPMTAAKLNELFTEIQAAPVTAETRTEEKNDQGSGSSPSVTLESHGGVVEHSSSYHQLSLLVGELTRIVSEMRRHGPRYKSHDLGFVDSVSASRVDDWADELEALVGKAQVRQLG